MSKTIVLCTGGFDPIHSGHINYLKSAKQLGDILVVGVNSDAWLTRKKGIPFMPLSERCEIVKNIVGVDFIIEFDDSDDSAAHAINLTRKLYPNDKIIFANGGDRASTNILELHIEDDNLEFAFNVGGNDKTNSSSWILQQWKEPKTLRPWGYYRILHQVSGTKVKELTIMPGQSLSMQRHNKRAEYWHVTDGKCRVEFNHAWIVLEKHKNLQIPPTEWHKLSNPYDVPCKIVEIQYGEYCTEDDIERNEQDR